MAFYRYLTKEGDRWDSIANEYRGNPYDYPDIMAANPNYIGVAYLPAGAIINVPVKEAPKRRKVTPPWER